MTERLLTPARPLNRCVSTVDEVSAAASQPNGDPISFRGIFGRRDRGSEPSLLVLSDGHRRWEVVNLLAIMQRDHRRLSSGLYGQRICPLQISLVSLFFPHPIGDLLVF